MATCAETEDTMTKVSNPPIPSARKKLERKLQQALQALQDERIAKPFASKLGDAIDLALDNRLISVIGHPGRRRKLGSELLDFCNVQLNDTELSYSARHHLELRGVLYVGELLRMTWDRKSPVRSELVHWLLGHGVSHPIDVVSAGWRPPYTDDPAVVRAWGEPIEWLFFRYDPVDYAKVGWWGSKTLAAYHNSGIHYLGHLGLRPTVKASDLRRLADRLRSHLPIRAGMVAVGWTPNSEPIAAWEQHRAAVALRLELDDRRTGYDDPWPEVLPALGSVERWLDLSPQVLDLSVRSSNCMRALEIKTIRQLAMYTEKDLLRWSNFGRKSLREIEDALNQLGLRLGMTAEEIEQTTSRKGRG